MLKVLIKKCVCFGGGNADFPGSIRRGGTGTEVPQQS